MRMKRFLCFVISMVMILPIISVSMVSTKADAASSKVETTLQWAIDTANDDSHGYSMTNRWGPDYDCTSFVISAFKYAGLPVGNATSAPTLKTNLTNNGFTWIPWNQINGVSNLKRGDILIWFGVDLGYGYNHAELYLGDNKLVGAHQDYGYTASGDQNGKEISVGNYYNYEYGGWTGVLRENVPLINNSTPSQPTLKVDAGKEGSATIFSWTKCENATHYDLRIYDSNDNLVYAIGNCDDAAKFNSLTMYTDTNFSYKGLKAGTYHAHVTAVNNDALSGKFNFELVQSYVQGESDKSL